MIKSANVYIYFNKIAFFKRIPIKYGHILKGSFVKLDGCLKQKKTAYKTFSNAVNLKLSFTYSANAANNVSASSAGNIAAIKSWFSIINHLAVVT